LIHLLILGLDTLIQPFVFAIEEIQNQGDDRMQDHKKDDIELLVSDSKQMAHPNHDIDTDIEDQVHFRP
jgi:hypothetical protein